MYYIYMLRCRDGSFYTGIAADIEKRLRQHASGGAACAKYTRAHPPEALAALWQAEDHAAAARLEALIKQLPREKKLALVRREADPESLLAPRLQGNRYTRLPTEPHQGSLVYRLPFQGGIGPWEGSLFTGSPAGGIGSRGIGGAGGLRRSGGGSQSGE